MNINLHNYEAFVLDYHEGRLTAGALEELMGFIANHPELEVDLDADLGLSLDILDDEAVKANFSDLKKSNFDLPPSVELDLAAFLEGDLKVLPNFEDKAQLERALKILEQCKLKADPSVTIDHAPLKFPLEVDMSLKENQLIALVEGDLTLLETENANDAAELALYQRVKLEASELVYANKQDLRRTMVVAFPFVRIAQYAAAAILIGAVALLGFYYTNGNSGQFYSANTSAPRAEKQVLDISVESTQPAESVSGAAVYQVTNVYTQDNVSGQGKTRVMPLPNRKIKGIAMEKQQAQIILSSRGSANDTPTELVAEQVTPQESFTPIKALLESKIKAGLYGSETYPQNNYMKALMTKASQKATDKINARKDVDFQVDKTPQSRRINLRIGKFELTRN
jgi:hypothetical protein